jgi:hypothetical protein
VVANPDYLTVERCTTAYVVVTENDVGEDGTNWSTSLLSVSGGTLGTASWISYRHVKYEAGATTGSDVVTYTIDGASGARATGTLYVTIVAGSSCP